MITCITSTLPRLGRPNSTGLTDMQLYTDSCMAKAGSTAWQVVFQSTGTLHWDSHTPKGYKGAPAGTGLLAVVVMAVGRFEPRQVLTSNLSSYLLCLMQAPLGPSAGCLCPHP
jgi:hypothetical protein